MKENMTSFLPHLNLQKLLTQLEHLEPHAEGKPESAAVEAAGRCVLRMSQYLGANGLLPFGAPNLPGVSKIFMTWDTCQISEKAQAEQGWKHLRWFIPK